MEKGEAREYGYFLAALRDELGKEGHGAVTRVAIDAGVTQPYLSGVKAGKEIASFDRQAAIAKALGFSYLEFLLKGQMLVDGVNWMPQTIQNAHEPPVTKIVKPTEKSVSGSILG